MHLPEPTRLRTLQVPKHVDHLVCARGIQEIEEPSEQFSQLLAADLCSYEDARVMPPGFSPPLGQHSKIGDVEAEDAPALCGRILQLLLIRGPQPARFAAFRQSKPF
jgi:hypothetical protein